MHDLTAPSVDNGRFGAPPVNTEEQAVAFLGIPLIRY